MENYSVYLHINLKMAKNMLEKQKMLLQKDGE